MKKLLLLILIPIAIGTAILNCTAQTWEPMGTNVAFNAQCFVEYKGDLYAGTGLSKEIKGIAKLEGKKWVTVGDGFILGRKFEANTFRVSALAVYKGELYAGGAFCLPGAKKAASIARWNGKEWKMVGEQLGTSPYPTINSFKVYNDELYVFGDFYIKRNDKAYYYAAKWDGEKWTPLGDWWNNKEWISYGIDYETDSFTLSGRTAIDGEYYSSGQCNNKEGDYADYVLKWNEGKWERLSKQIGGSTGISDIAVYNGALYAAESFFEQSDLTEGREYKRKEIVSIKKWNGTKWVSCGAFDKPVQCLYVYKGELIVSGLFTEIGGKEIKYMARYKEEIEETE